MDTGIDRIATVVMPAQSASVLDDQQAAPQCFGADWALPPLRDYAPGRHVIYPASTRLVSRHKRLAAALAVALMVWAGLESLPPLQPATRMALAAGAGVAVFAVLTARGAMPD